MRVGYAQHVRARLLYGDERNEPGLPDECKPPELLCACDCINGCSYGGSGEAEVTGYLYRCRLIYRAASGAARCCGAAVYSRFVPRLVSQYSGSRFADLRFL